MNYEANKLYLTEKAVNEVDDWLRANLATYVDQVNNQFGDDGRAITITTPSTGDIAEWRWQMMPPLPALTILPQEASALEDLNGYIMSRHPLVVVVADTDADQNVLRRKLLRQAVALIQCLLAGAAAGAFVMFWQDARVMARYSSIAIVDETFFADAQVYIEIQIEETYG